MKLSKLISLMLLSAIASQLLPNTTSVSRAEPAQRRSPDNRQVVSKKRQICICKQAQLENL